MKSESPEPQTNTLEDDYKNITDSLMDDDTIDGKLAREAEYDDMDEQAMDRAWFVKKKKATKTKANNVMPPPPGFCNPPVCRFYTNSTVEDPCFVLKSIVEHI